MFNTEQANCTSLDPELFFPVNNMSPRIEKLLKKTCLECAIFDDCIDYALKVKVNGYWAATTEKARDDLRKMLNIIPVRIDQFYKDLVDIPTPEAMQKRKSIKKLKEAGKR
jgi:WhiB family redox-sensing transcriptional regulator